MPEGPEVYIIAKGLNENLQGYRILDYEIDKSSKFIDMDLSPLLGKTISSIEPYGKKVIFSLQGLKMVSSLGLEGHWLFSEDPEKFEDYPNKSITFTLIKNDLYMFLMFADSRRFGLLSIAKNFEEYKFIMKDVGLSWVQNEVSLENFSSMIHNKRFKSSKVIVDFLVEQKYFSGIGNYMRSEILYYSNVHPLRTLNSLSPEEINDIYTNTYRVIKDAIKTGGHTLHTFKDPEGSKGGYSPVIYGRKFTKDKNLVIETMKDSGNRSIYYASTQV